MIRLSLAVLLLLSASASAQTGLGWASDGVWRHVFPDATVAVADLLSDPDLDRLAAQVEAGHLGEVGGGVPDTMALHREQELQRAIVLLQIAMPGYVHDAAEAGDEGEDGGDSDLLTLRRRATALRDSSAALRQDHAEVLAADTRAVAFRRGLGADRMVVAINAGDESAFLPLPGEGVPEPLVPIAVSSGERVASLVIQLYEEHTTYGLRIPARTTVLYRPAVPSDVRPRGLDE